MASLGSPPFLLNASSGDNISILQSRTTQCCRPGFLAHFPASPFDPNGGFDTLRFGRVPKGGFLVGFSLTGREVKKGPRATRKGDGVDQGVDNNDDDDDDDAEVVDDALRATIRTSKKVLEMQKNLLQQIEERKKLISSIKDSVASPEVNTLTYDENDSSFSNLDLSSISEKFQRNNESSTSSDGGSQSTEVKGSETAPTEASRVILSQGKRYVNNLSDKNSIADTTIPFPFTEQREPKVGTTKPKIPPFPSEALESYDVKEVKLQNLAELNVQGASVEHDVAHDEVKMDSPPLAGVDVMNIILVSAECAPWSKTGGLGDVAGALPKALARRGHRVMAVAPKYAEYSGMQMLGERRRYNVNGQDMEVTYFHAFIDGVDFVFIDSPIFRHLGNGIYGGNRLEILKRMVLFCKAAVEVPWHVPCGGVCYGDGNLVFIANDWHTALLPVYLKAYYRNNGLMRYTRCILVIHNIAHQGRGPLDDFCHLDLPGHYMELFKLYDPYGGDHFNIFAAGLKTADRVITVSHGYAWELKTSEGGWGLHEIINENDWKFHGIVNGIDTKDWNPRFDVHLKSDGYTNYSLETLHTGKPQCKAALQREVGLPIRNDVPVLAFIGRLDHQKGVDLIAEAMPWIAGQDVQLIMLGSGRQDLEDMLRSLESRHHDKVRGWVGFSVKMAHRITAGADVLLMPSRFEPCGLNQLYAMMYGTVPVVHAVGGLKDTVVKFNPYNETGVGWTFKRAEANRLIDALGHCLNTYRNYKTSWEGLQRRGMSQDLSWDNAARSYEEVLLAAKYQW